MIVHARWGQVKWGLAGQQLAVAPKVGGGTLSSEHLGQFRVIHAEARSW